LTRVHRARSAWVMTFFVLQLGAIGLTRALDVPRLVLADWQAATFTLALRADGIALALWLALLIPFAAIWLAAPRAPFDFSAFGIFTGAMLLIAADGAPAILGAWILLDLALFARRLAHEIEIESAARGLIVGIFAALIFFAGALMNNTMLVALALWARLALYPFQPALPTRGADVSDLWSARAAPMLAGAALWMRWDALGVDPPGAWLAWLAGGTFLVALIWIWREEEPARAVAISATHALTLIPLAITFASKAGAAFALWLAIGAAFAFGFFELALRWRADNRNRYPRLLWFAGVIALAGAPLTPGFFGRAGTYIALWESGQWFGLLLAGVATTELLAPLWNFAFALSGTETRDPKRGEYAGLAILVFAIVILALAAVPFAQMLDAPLRASADAAMTRVIWTDDALGVIIALIFLLAPIIASYFLRGVARAVRPRPSSVATRLARWLDLVWFEHALMRIGNRVGLSARNISGIAEENPTVWLLLVGLWVAILILVAR
ncbi:MAG: hypothetical protein HZC40_17720, partial [Chloroflexi bacterium]|nr:hypothetical protein [Chloroflexota bacterium]